jgi:YidC/Oxa1 family membrane protein insertase
MDKKNFTIGALLLVGAFAVLFFGPKSPPPAPVPPPSADKTAAQPAGTPAAATATTATAQPAHATTAHSAFAAVNHDSADATVTKLANHFIEARFTDSGGALLEVAFIKRDEKDRLIYPEKLGGNEPFVFNALHSDPILAIVDFPGLDRTARYERVSATATEIVYRAVLDGRLEVTRRYTLSPDQSETGDPYQIRHETVVRNLTDQTAPPMRLAVSLGTAAPAKSDDPGLQLKAGYANGSKQEFIARTELEAGNGFFGIGSHSAKPSVTSPGPVVWAAVKDQFFASILTGDEPASALITRRVKLHAPLPDEMPNAYGISGATQFDLKAIAAKSEAKLGATLYVGPKEYRRLANSTVFKADQDKIMDFGFFKFFSQILLTLMTWIHGFTQNWGLAIILTTLSLKTIFIPFTLAASKSAKRMAKIQPELQAIREKYKDNPQKQQQATMELFKTRKINPVGGCFPILITIPFFMGFFQMLQSTAELRFAPFLWAPDLSSTDTVAVLFGMLPLNIMPILMGATMVVQMHLTPSPSVDNAQMKMMKFMPYIFTLFCYSFSCALSLYSFVNGLFTIVQQLVINKMKDAEETAPVVAVGPGGKVVKNVTPTSKKLK